MAPSGPTAAPFGPPGISAIVSVEPSGGPRQARAEHLDHDHRDRPASRSVPRETAARPRSRSARGWTRGRRCGHRPMMAPVTASACSPTWPREQTHHSQVKSFTRTQIERSDLAVLLEQLELLDGHQHGPGLRALARRRRRLFEQIHDPPGAANPTLSLRCSIEVDPSWLRTTNSIAWRITRVLVVVAGQNVLTDRGDVEMSEHIDPAAPDATCHVAPPGRMPGAPSAPSPASPPSPPVRRRPSKPARRLRTPVEQPPGGPRPRSTTTPDPVRHRQLPRQQNMSPFPTSFSAPVRRGSRGCR